jgi:hypothetical protein
VGLVSVVLIGGRNHGREGKEEEKGEGTSGER